MRKAIIILNGELNYKSEFYQKYKNYTADFFCADGGANYAYKLAIVPDLIIGDLDSIKEEVKLYYKNLNIKFEKYPVEKDYTDSELIISKIHDKYDELIVLGGMGGRTDHFLSNIYLLEKYPKIKFINEKEEIFLINKDISILDRKNIEISFLAIDKKVKNITLEGFKYPLKNYTLERGSSITISNVITSNKAKVKLESGKMLVIINTI